MENHRGEYKTYTYLIKIPVSLLSFLEMIRSLEVPISFSQEPGEPHSLYLSCAVTGVVTAAKESPFISQFPCSENEEYFTFHLEICHYLASGQKLYIFFKLLKSCHGQQRYTFFPLSNTPNKIIRQIENYKI